MSLITIDDNEGPAVHALVIGVGHYRYLSGGDDEQAQSIEAIGILKQLTSPPRSAIAFKDWLTRSAGDWKVPVATIEMLVSPAPQDATAGAQEESFTAATMDNIRAAYRNWKRRCDSHPDNIAVFFYSGHGVEKSEQFLLAEDFGEDPDNPWLGAFDFDNTRRAFHATQAKTQCFFVDACRKVTSSMLRQQVSVSPLDTPNFLNSAECEYDLTLKASASNEAAYGEEQKPSYFTQAILAALQGAVAIKKENIWQVTSGRISAHIYDVLSMINSSQDYRQRCTISMTNSTKLLKTDRPNVRISVFCSPDNANNYAQLSCINLDGRIDVPLTNPDLPQNIELQAGIYEFTAAFPGNEFNTTTHLSLHNPPLDKVKLECLP